MTCKHVNIGEIKLTFKSIRERTTAANEYNSECTRVVLHIYDGFKWYLITEFVPSLTRGGQPEIPLTQKKSGVTL